MSVFSGIFEDVKLEYLSPSHFDPAISLETDWMRGLSWLTKCSFAAIGLSFWLYQRVTRFANETGMRMYLRELKTTFKSLVI